MTDSIAIYTGTRPPDVSISGLAVRHRPMLESRAVEFDRERLLELCTQPAAIVLYSQNAIRALEARSLGEPLAARDHLQWWAVGDQTANCLSTHLGIDARVPDRQRFEGMQEVLDETELPDRVISLSLKGKTRDLSSILEPRGIEWIDVPIYETVAATYEGLSAEIAALSPDWILFTSSRGVKAFADHIDRAELRLETVSRVAIGPKTASTVASHIGDVDIVPDRPSIEGMFDAIERHLHDGVAR